MPAGVARPEEAGPRRPGLPPQPWSPAGPEEMIRRSWEQNPRLWESIPPEEREDAYQRYRERVLERRLSRGHGGPGRGKINREERHRGKRGRVKGYDRPPEGWSQGGGTYSGEPGRGDSRGGVGRIDGGGGGGRNNE